MLVKLVLSIIILVYAALQTDLNRKCKNKNAVSESESSILQYINVTMLTLATAGVLYFGHQVIMPALPSIATKLHF